jgi:predicted nucleic acid-binding protein
MNIFLDTSSLVKLYHEEIGTDAIDAIFRNQTITGIYLSDLTKVEFASTFWKKTRTGEISAELAEEIIQLFTSDSGRYSFLPIYSVIVEQAQLLLDKYGSKGLRTLDSIQLATATCIGSAAALFKTCDNLLDSLLISESLPVALP